MKRSILLPPNPLKGEFQPLREISLSQDESERPLLGLGVRREIELLL